MKKTDALKQIEQGLLMALVCEYRSGKAETIRWTDKQTRAKMEAPAITHGVEVGPTQIRVQERTPDGFDVAKYVSPFKRGELVLLHVESIERDSGNISARGTIEALT
jgi:hypothetical protein